MSWTITGNPVAMCDTQHAGKEIVTWPKSEYFANDPECHDLLLCALRSHTVAGLGGCPTGPPVGGVMSTSTPALCGPVALYLLQWPISDLVIRDRIVDTTTTCLNMQKSVLRASHQIFYLPKMQYWYISVVTQVCNLVKVINKSNTLKF